ncbi:ATPase family AAA domain-containing protein 5 isoform X1 [Schistocerca piceifrons]|uniref:ATPase family AAA domain-containing protein 5 isoform X1 n=1 Tax=Schistocerca piceifrons TaxID=274613 RepID=UPI001F5F9100|nr:ATPase family AAA domain-containing protein 5 isoform X1 [Schistocerca piceifrons]
MKSIADYFHISEKICANSFEVTDSMETSSSKNSHIFVQKVKLNIQLKESSETCTLTSPVVKKASSEKNQRVNVEDNVCKDSTSQEKDADATANNLLKGKDDNVAHEMRMKNIGRRKRVAALEKPASKQIKRLKHSYVIVESDSVDDDDDDNIIEDDDDDDDNCGGGGDVKRKGKRATKKAFKESRSSSQKQKKKRKADMGDSARAEGRSGAKRLRVSPKALRQLKDRNSDKRVLPTVKHEIKSTDCGNLLEENPVLPDENTLKKNNMFGKLDITITKSDRIVNNVKVSTAESESEINCDEMSTDNKIEITVSSSLSDCEQKKKKQNNCHNNVSPDEETRRQSNLFNYFGKVSKQDIKSKPDRIEVQAIVHTPVSSFRGKNTNSKLRIKKPKKGKASSHAAEAADEIEVLGSEDLSVNQDEGTNARNAEAITVAENSQLNTSVSSIVNEDIKEKLSSPGKGWKLRIRLRDATADGNEELSSTGTSNSKHSFFKQCQEKKEETFLQEKTTSVHTTSRRNRLSLSNNHSVLNEMDLSSSEAETSAVSQITQVIDSETTRSSKVCKSPEKLKAKECLRLAPVFTKKTTKKLKPDADSILAKKSFLESGVPETLKKTVELSRLAEEQEQVLPIFPAISHIQQLDSEDIWKLPCVALPLKSGVQELNEANYSSKIWLLRELVEVNKDRVIVNCREKHTFPCDILCKIVSDIKSQNSDLPVRRLFKNLTNKYILGKGGDNKEQNTDIRKKKKRLRNRKSKQHEIQKLQKINDPEPTISWCEKYKPVNSNEVLGTKRMAVQLKKWLESWKLRSKDTKKQNKKIRNGASSSDEEFEYSESSGGSDFNKAAILLGPHGSGKTSSVYAVANELGFEVLEINASSRRTGKRILADLQEATQSHRIGVPGADSNQSTITKIFKRGKGNSKTDSNERSMKKEMSLILVEEVDIVFDDYDEGFVSALSTLVTTSKRPVIFTATDENCLQVTRLVDKHLVLKYDIVPSRILNIWLQLLCLLEGVRVSSAAIKNVLEFTHYDIRKSMMLLQFWVLSGGENFPFDCVSNDDSLHRVVCSESADNSNLSWSSLSEEVTIPEESANCTCLFTNCNNSLSHELNIPFPLDLCGVWWNLAPLLGLPQVKLRERREVLLCGNKQPKKKECETFLYYDSDSADDDKEKKSWFDVADSIEDDKHVSCDSERVQNSNIQTPNKCSNKVIKAMADLMDSLSSVDVMNFTVDKCIGNSGYQELKVHCWDQKPQDSTSLLEDQTAFSALELPSLAHCLTERSIAACIKDLNILDPQKYNHVLPSHETVRLISEEHFLSSAVWDIVPQSCWLSRNAMSTDYCPLIRSMSRLQDSHLRIEQMATTRCRQRYFHYLKDLGTSADIATCKALCSVLNN